MVGDVLPRHRKIDELRVSQPFGEVQQKGDDAFGGGLTGQDQGVILAPLDGPDRDLPQGPRQTDVGGGALRKLRARPCPRGACRAALS
jgi:hypothetical protein